jgi:uncharacterized membrane protein YccC
MLERSRELLAIDPTKADLRKGVFVVIAVVIAVVVVAFFGLVGETAGLAALFVLATDRPGSARDRVRGVLIVTLAGSFIAFLAVWAGTDHALLAALLAFVVTAVTTLASGRSPTVAGRALVLSIWAIFALSFSGDTRTAVELALAFMLGGAIATGVLWFQSRGASDEPLEQEARAALKSFDELITSPLAAIALIRASAVAIGTVLGILWFPEHPVWPALTVLLVMTSKPGEAIGAGLLRTFGTFVGVLVAEAVVLVAGGSEAILLVAFALFAFGMFAFKNVAFWVYVLFLTGVLILMQALVGAAAVAAAVDRLTATVLGAFIAFVGIGIGRLIVSPEDRQPRAE